MDFSDIEWVQFLINLTHYIDSQVASSSGHSSNVADWAKTIAQEFDFCENDTQSVFWAAMLHDIGKIGVPEHILCKNGPLDPTEWEMMRLHPIVGASIVSSLEGINHIAPIIYSHQEKFDGTGYPQGLIGDYIPLGARIVSVVDAYEAMTSDRVYRKARTHSDAISELERMGGKQFDPKVVEKFIEVAV